ncbi:glutamate racemase [uncultured Erythrobacter sp.]|uniref:glutamate racemase n=1 Tax=uncultured Erythrobacter sp. TaxID=263913 RepID=UPI002624F0A1|nr:glutamate racemase [uncultured Erythrobacter sp.]
MNNVDPSSPILLLDTGVGGLSVLGEVRKCLPDAPILFAADYAGQPYGQKTEAQVAARVAGLLGRMTERYRPRLACIACNTASTIALGMVREVLEIPIVGTVPAIKPAAENTLTGVIGLLGTAGTIRQKYVDDLESEFASGTTLLRHAAPELVDEAEAKLRGGTPDRKVLAAALNALSEQDEAIAMDQVILGCTHFPLIRDELADVAMSDLGWSPDVQFIDGAAGIARRIAHLLDGHIFERTGPDRAVTTGDVDHFFSLEPVLLSYGIDQIEQF